MKRASAGGFIYLTAVTGEQQACRSIGGASILPMRLAATMIDGMKAQTVGRVLGVGLRVAGRMAGQRLAGAQPTSSRAPVSGASGGAREGVRQAATYSARAGGSVARGVGGFLRPFGRVGGKILQEVTGVFFLLFVLVFGSWAWRTRASYAQGPEHVRFLVYAGVMLLFLYLSASSFWRAKRR